MERNKQAIASTQVTTDVVTFVIDGGKLKVLLVKRTQEPYKGSWSLPGGFLWANETTHEAAMRLLKSKAGVADVYLEQLYTFDATKRDPRGKVISVSYLALVPFELLKVEKSDETQEPTLFSIDELPQLAFDHKDIIEYAYTRLKAKLQYTNVAYSLLPEAFTFYQLQLVYENIMSATLDRRNFRKKYMSLGLLKPTGKRKSGGQHRPAELYSFIKKEPVEIQRWF